MRWNVKYAESFAWATVSDAPARSLYQFSPPAESETGLLYLKLIGARGLTPEGKKEELLGATVRVSTCVSIRKRPAGQDPEYQASLVSKPTESSSRDASWLHEMAFTLLDKSRPLWVQILDKSKKIIAHGQLSTAGLTEGKLGKVKLVLTNVFAPTVAVVSKSKTSTATTNDDPTKCKMYILAQFTSAQVRQPVSWNIPPIRVQLSHSEYAPGEEVNGVLILNAPEQIKAEHVVLTFMGRIKVDTSDMVDQSVQTTFEHSVDLFNDSILCWTDRDRQVLPAGFYVWPFRFRLPDRLPPTHATYYGNVQYVVRAALYRSGALVSKKKKVDSELVVLSSPTLYHSVLKPEERPSQVMRRAVFKAGGETITIKAKLAFSPVIIGSPLLLKIIVDNESTKQLKGVVVKLLVNTTYRAPGRSTTIVENICENRPMPDDDVIPVDSRQILKVVLDIPATTQPSLPPQMSSILEAQYLIEIQLNGAAGFTEDGKLLASMPLLLSHNVASEQTRLKTYRAQAGSIGVGDKSPGSSRRQAVRGKNSTSASATANADDEILEEGYQEMRSDNPLDNFLPMPGAEDYTSFPSRVPTTIKTPSNTSLEIRNATQTVGSK